jgi:hypothetical protein
MFEIQLFVIQAHEMKNRSMKIVYVYRIANDIIPKLVRLTIYNSRFHAASRHPDGIATWMVVASIIVLR